MLFFEFDLNDRDPSLVTLFDRLVHPHGSLVIVNQDKFNVWKLVQEDVDLRPRHVFVVMMRPDVDNHCIFQLYLHREIIVLGVLYIVARPDILQYCDAHAELKFQLRNMIVAGQIPVAFGLLVSFRVRRIQISRLLPLSDSPKDILNDTVSSQPATTVTVHF